ncbi:MAG: poly[(R)-3-hydroxyalkanoate] polymerase subunit PhaC [Betaproteobacteria bacterium]|nr:poly[(R)-3-hydroxyalkanoate] polymerase subunit PhaC [Betaproteobacteria bacterium]
MASCVMQPVDSKVVQSVAERSSKILADFAQKQAQSLSSAMRDEMGIAKAYMDLYAKMANDPALVASMSVNLWVDYMRLWQSSWMKMFGMQSAPIAQPAKSDSRFKGEDWSTNFLFDLIKQSYLISARHIQDAVSKVEGLSPESEKKVAFFTRQYVDALSPTNFLLTNPQVLRETVASGGQNLVRGLNNLLADIEKGGGQLQISMTDEKAFKLGENVATTPGSVVFENELMQLIQYKPATDKVLKRPLIIVPPWINKYYILDLREKNSFIKWAVNQGHTVFVVSWVNPDAKLAQKGFDDYMREGPLAALDAVERATGEREVNFIGYCLGGTLLGATLAYLAAKGDERVKSATFFVSLLDFSQPGELGVFIDEAQVESLERKMNERGYLEGSEMASTFNMLRSNDLVWSFVVNNYLMGKDPFPFDLLYWNADSTRMPARMHSFYLRNMYIKNLMGVPGGIQLAGTPIDLAKVKIPSYFISTVEDHIAPWKTTYKGAKYLKGPVRFVLGGSGHIAGIVNPPAAKKYHYWSNDALPETAEKWFESATQRPGSWWEDWQAWIEKTGADKVPARIPQKAIEPAPGRYAKLRLSTKVASS